TLVEAKGLVMTHKQLLKAVWGPHSGQHHEYLRVYMTHLRRKLAPPPNEPSLIITEPGIGYRLRSDVPDERPSTVGPGST
ncbi:MAG: winged helix-turn-helix domain-containing protein, partial [bacterium]